MEYKSISKQFLPFHSLRMLKELAKEQKCKVRKHFNKLVKDTRVDTIQNKRLPQLPCLNFQRLHIAAQPIHLM